MQSKPDTKHGVYRVTHRLRRDDLWYACESDLIFIDQRPFVVLERAGDQPRVKLPLDRAPLEVMPGPPGYFLYNGELLDPRKPDEAPPTTRRRRR